MKISRMPTEAIGLVMAMMRDGILCAVGARLAGFCRPSASSRIGHSPSHSGLTSGRAGSAGRGGVFGVVGQVWRGTWC